jgi:hypothetical protein
MGLDIETGAQAQNCPGVLRDVGLKKRDPHHLWAFMTGLRGSRRFVAVQ